MCVCKVLAKTGVKSLEDAFSSTFPVPQVGRNGMLFSVLGRGSDIPAFGMVTANKGKIKSFQKSVRLKNCSVWGIGGGEAKEEI